MPPPVEARLLPILDATREAIRSGNWFSKTYESQLDRLLAAKDRYSVEAMVALLEYPISAAYAEEILCSLATGGSRTLQLLQLYDRCDIRPSRSPVERDPLSSLRSITIQVWKKNGGKGSCARE
jgi:hypothetical protein